MTEAGHIRRPGGQRPKTVRITDMIPFIKKSFMTLAFFLAAIVPANAQPNPKETMKDTTTDLKKNDMLVRISEIEVYPGHLQEYLAFARTVGETSVREEPGVIAIFPMTQQRDSCQIRILEIYADREAYERHIATDHFRTYKQATLHMVKSLDLVDMIPMNPQAMSEIFLKTVPSENKADARRTKGKDRKETNPI